MVVLHLKSVQSNIWHMKWGNGYIIMKSECRGKAHMGIVFHNEILMRPLIYILNHNTNQCALSNES